MHATFAAPVCVALSCIVPAAASAQISGRVIDQDSREPIVHAEVVLLDSADVRAATVTSDSAGYFLIPRPAPGRYRIRVQRLGYTTHTSDEIVLQAGEPVVVELRMAARGIAIEPLIVHARGRERGRDGFMRRRDLGTGAFLTPDSIELRHPRQVADAFRAADGIIMYERPGYSTRIGSMRGHRCLMVFVDHYPDPFAMFFNGYTPMVLPRMAMGLPVNSSRGLDMFDVEQVLGIEVYASYKQVPDELRGVARMKDTWPCGVAIVWTGRAW